MDRQYVFGKEGGRGLQFSIENRGDASIQRLKTTYHSAEET